ncbi:flagellar protein FlhE [Halomonas sp. 18071143]|uniref:flagellar protein FlhE n=1 Tax=Halomonas sp. 18071143 TaxID=2855441 RepID=UPI001C48DEEC|nr:flagellar protein FlhE [Halomonas sp. 18071143]
MSGRRRLGWLGGLSALAVMALSQPTEAAGSWVAEVQGVRVTMAEREVRSAPLVAPTAVPGDATLAEVSWRYRLPPGEAVRAWLCQGEACTALSGERGTTRAFSGGRVHEPLHFRFALMPGHKRMIQVQGLQLIANYH